MDKANQWCRATSFYASSVFPVWVPPAINNTIGNLLGTFSYKKNGENLYCFLRFDIN